MIKSREKLIVESLESIFGRTVKAIVTDGRISYWGEEHELQPSDEDLEIRINQLIAEIPLELLRKERDFKLTECDWRMAPDYPYDDQQDWIEYRKMLRDLPSLIKAGQIPMPEINDDNLLVFGHWPEKPIG